MACGVDGNELAERKVECLTCIEFKKVHEVDNIWDFLHFPEGVMRTM